MRTVWKWILMRPYRQGIGRWRLNWCQRSAGADCKCCHISLHTMGKVQQRRMSETNRHFEGGRGKTTCFSVMKHQFWVISDSSTQGKGDMRLTSMSWALGWWSDTAGLRAAVEMGSSPKAKHANHSETVPVSSARAGHRASLQSDWFWSLPIWAGFRSTA